MEPVDIMFLFFAGSTLYFTFLFLILFLKNRKKLYDTSFLFNLPSVSIITPVYNEEKNIARTINAIKKLKYPKNLLEIIVVNDGSEDNTLNVLRKIKGIKVINKKHGGKASTLNAGLKAAKGEIIACIDSDSYPNSDALMKSIPFFKDKSVAAVTTSIFVKKPRNLLERLQWIEYAMIVWSRKLLEFLDSVYVTPGPLSLYRKNILLKVGGFDEKNMTEDIEIAWRLLEKGYKIKMATNAKVHTRVPRNFRKWWKQRIRWNIGGIQTTLKYKYTLFKKEFKSLGNFVLPFFLLSYVLSILGLGLFIYIIGKWIYDLGSFVFQAYLIGLNPINHLELYILPNVFSFFGVLIFIVSIIWVKISLSVTKEKISSRPKSLIDLLLYLTFYITIFPFVLVQSTWKFLRKKYKW